MQKTKKHKGTFLFLLLVFAVLLVSNVSLGTVYIPFQTTIYSIFGGEIANPQWEYIILHFRLPKAMLAILIGIGLSVSGLLMQTLFRNPMAGPFVLGISSGASLGVGILIFLGAYVPFLSVLAQWKFGTAIAASAGALLVMVTILLSAKRIKNTMSILIIGLMFASFTGALISVFTYFGSAEELKRFLFWGFGSIASSTWTEIQLLALISLLCFLGIIYCIKPLNQLLLGENYAKSAGVSIWRTRNILLLCTSLLTGAITAIAGPIAFIGLAVPHISKMLFKTSKHEVLLPAVGLMGAILVLLCDTIAQVPFSEITLPLNAITSIIGAPLVIWLLLQKKNIIY